MDGLYKEYGYVHDSGSVLLAGLIGIASPFGRYHACHIIHLLLRLTVIHIVVFVLLLLRLYLIKGICIDCRANQPVFVFVCCASTSMKAILLTELVLC